MKQALIVYALSASAALAHPGHDAALSGAAHYLLSPLHGLGVIALAALAWGLVRRTRG